MNVFSDQLYLRRCLTLAQQAVGKTAPNPMVGCVIVNQGRVVGEGYHPQAGQPHAEVFALRQAGDASQGATLYVNLEPCNHYGKTPPCTEAIIDAGIQQVVVGMVDPNPLVSGKGITRLRQAGIMVTVGVEQAACERLNEAFCFRVSQRRPFGIFKYAMTLDGKIATTGEAWCQVTSPTARQWVHQLRGQCQAVIVGGNTVRQDNPHLTTHGQGDRQPLRVVMSRSLALPKAAYLWDQTVAKTLVFTQAGADLSQQNHLQQLGVQVVVLEKLSPLAVMQTLNQWDCLQVLWECGGQLAAVAIAEGTIQKIHGFIAPKIIGGHSAPSPVGDLGLTQMTQALPVESMTCQAISSDWLFTGYLSASAT